MKMFFLCLLFAPILLWSDFDHIKYSKEGPNVVGYLYIGDHAKTINQGTWIYVKNALEYYQKVKPIFIILELDTPGGEVFAAQKISDALKNFDTQESIPVVAFINNWAISAGAMLAYSCRYIAIAKDASMGAAEPITQTGEKTSEKVHSALRADFAGRAAFFGRNPLIAEAMVDQDLLLVERSGKIVQLEKDDQILPTDRIVSRKGKLLTLNANELMEWKVADVLLLPEKLAPGKMLLFTAPFFKEIPQVKVDAFKPDWKIKFFSFLAAPLVASLLLLGLMVATYVEINTGGFGAAAIIGLICLSLIVLSSFAVEAAPMLELILLIAGVVLILIEVFVTPTFGFLGIIGILLALVGLITLLLPGLHNFHFDFDTKTFNAAGEFFLERAAWFAATFIVGIILITILAKYITPKLHLFSPLVLRKTQEGYDAAPSQLPEKGAEGIVVAPLRTAGKVKIGHEVFDAVSSGAFLETGTKVKVIEKAGNKVVVEEIS